MTFKEFQVQNLSNSCWIINLKIMEAFSKK